jgi:hypothetical protein
MGLKYCHFCHKDTEQASVQHGYDKCSVCGGLANKAGCFQIKVTSLMDHPKCPRCWSRNGIPDNYQGMCDQCQRQVKAGIDDYVRIGNMTEEEGEALRTKILENERAQVEKYRRKLP